LIRWRGGKDFNKISTVLRRYDLLSETENRYRRPVILRLPIDVIPWLHKFVEFAIEHAPFAGCLDYFLFARLPANQILHFFSDQHYLRFTGG
jgi:hypothetical protein